MYRENGRRGHRERLLLPFIDLLAPCSSGHTPPLFLSGYLSFCMCTPLPASLPDCEIQNPAVKGGNVRARQLLPPLGGPGSRGALLPGCCCCCARGKMCVLARAPARGRWEQARASPYGGRAAAPLLLVPYLENAASHNLSTSTYRRPIMQSTAAYRRFA